MMIVVFTLGIIILTLLLRKQIRKLDSIKKIFIVIYIIWWTICIIMANTTYGNTFKISNNTTFTFLSAIIAFIVGFFAFDIARLMFNKRKKKCKKNELKVESQVERKFIPKILSQLKKNLQSEKILKNMQIVIQILLLIILIYYKAKQMQAISIYGDSIKRIAVFEIGYIFSSTIEAALFNYVICTVVRFLNIIMVKNILTKKINITVFLEILISITMFLITYGRAMFFEIILYILFWIIILYGNSLKKYLKQNKKVIIGALSVAFITLTISSFLRIGMNNFNIDILKKNLEQTSSQAIIYFAGGPKAFEQSLKQDYRAQIIEKYGKETNGMATFAWIGQIYEKITHKENTLNNVLGEIMQKEIKIGEYQTFNAFFTCLFNFYIDFEYFGIYFFQFIYGFFLSWMINFYLKNKNLGRGVLLNINLTFAILSETRWSYQSIANLILIILAVLLICFTEKRGRNEDNVVM